MEHRKGFFFIAVVVLFGAATTQAQNITYIDPVTDATISAKSIDTELWVGATVGNHAVTASGGGTFSIPIFSPPGTNGMQPHIALAYNSQRGDGPLGMGWGISGLSAITRTGSDKYHDNHAAPVSYTNEDHFALDGQRLVPTNGGDYGAAGTVYDTEQAQFLWVTITSYFPDGEPETFDVREKSGLRKRYNYFNGWGSGAYRESGPRDQCMAIDQCGGSLGK